MNFEEAVEKIKEIDGLANDYEVAKLFSLAPSDFNRRKKKGLLAKQITEWAIDRGVNLNWLWTGKGERKIGEDILNLLKLSADLNAMNQRMAELERNAIGHGKIRQGDPEEKKDELLNMRTGVVHVQFNRKNDGSKNG